MSESEIAAKLKARMKEEQKRTLSAAMLQVVKEKDAVLNTKVQIKLVVDRAALELEGFARAR